MGRAGQGGTSPVPWWWAWRRAVGEGPVVFWGAEWAGMHVFLGPVPCRLIPPAEDEAGGRVAERPPGRRETVAAPDSALRDERRRWLVPGLLALVLAVSLLSGLGGAVALSAHEALVTATARNMLEGRPVRLADGSRPSPFLVPNFNDEPRLRKTPLPYWLVAGVGRLAALWDGGPDGIPEWAARVPSALASLATVGVLAWLVGRERGWTEGWLAASALGTMVGFLLWARRAMAEAPLTFFTTASLAAAWTAARRPGGPGRAGWLAAAGLAAGLAVLAKGPVPLLFLPGPLLVLAVWGLARRLRGGRPMGGARHEAHGAQEAASAVPKRAARAGPPVEGPPLGVESAGRDRAGPRTLRWTVLGVGLAVVVFLATALPWPLYVWLRVPEAGSVWFAQSVGRAVGEFGHEEPPWFYLLRLPVLVLPWTYFVFHGMMVAVRRAWARPGDRPWFLFVGAWLAVPLIGFSLAAGKQDHYLVPALPAAAVYAGLAMKALFAPAPEAAGRAARPDGSRGRRAALAHGLAFVAAGVAAVVYVARAHRGPAEAGAWAGSLLAAGGLAAVVLARRRGALPAYAALGATVLLVFPLAWTRLGGPLDKAGPARRFGREVARLVPAGAPVFFLGERNATVIYYAHRPIPLATDGRSLVRPAAEGGEVGDGTGLFVITRTPAPPAPLAPAAPSASSAPPDRPARTALVRWRLVASETVEGNPNRGFWLFRLAAAGERSDLEARGAGTEKAGPRGTDTEPVSRGAQDHG